MIAMNLRMLVREPTQSAVTNSFVKRIQTLPFAPFKGLRLKGLPNKQESPTDIDYEVLAIRFNVRSGELEVFVHRHGDASPLQPSLTEQDAIALGWLTERVGPA